MELNKWDEWNTECKTWSDKTMGMKMMRDMNNGYILEEKIGAEQTVSQKTMLSNKRLAADDQNFA